MIIPPEEVGGVGHTGAGTGNGEKCVHVCRITDELQLESLCVYIPAAVDEDTWE